MNQLLRLLLVLDDDDDDDDASSMRMRMRMRGRESCVSRLNLAARASAAGEVMGVASLLSETGQADDCKPKSIASVLVLVREVMSS